MTAAGVQLDTNQSSAHLRHGFKLMALKDRVPVNLRGDEALYVDLIRLLAGLSLIVSGLHP